MKLRKRIRKVPEMILVVIARGAIPWLSRRAVLRLSRVLGAAAYWGAGSLRRVAAANLDLAFGDSRTDAEKRAINKASFQSFALVLLDLFWFNRNTYARLETYLRYDDSFRLYFQNPSAIVLSGHIGNWEIVSVGCGAWGVPMTSIARPIKNAFADRELNLLREKTGAKIATRKGAIRHVIKALRAGRGTALAVDQNTLPEEGGVFVPFFGVPVPVTKAASTLWARTKATMIMSWCIPDEHGVYTVYAKSPFSMSDKLSSSDVVATRVTQALEDVIREHPRHWLWSYKRWRFYREQDDKAQFPFYAESYENYVEHRRLVKQHRAAKQAEVDEEAQKTVGSSAESVGES